MQTALIDSHCHFDFEPLNRAEIWQRCRSRGISHLIIPGVAEHQWPHAHQLSLDHKGIFYAAGIHPWWLKPGPTTFADALIAQLDNDRCVAIGETGLDRHIDLAMEVQVAALERHLAIAEDLQRPLIIHCVGAHNALIRALKSHRLAAGGVIHAFSGSYEIAQTYWRMGFRLGVGGTITYPRAKKTRAAIARMPLDSLLLETDAPDMPLYGHQGKPNSPEKLPEVARCLAELRGESDTLIAHGTTANALALFRLAAPG